MYAYGTGMLGILVKSDLAGPSDKALLDAVWEGTYTGMSDAAIHQLVAQAGAQEALTREQAASVSSFSNADDLPVQHMVDGTKDHPAASSATPGLPPSDQVFDTLRREILAARLKITLDEQLNHVTSPAVMQLAHMKLPPIVRPGQRDEHADVAGPKPD